MYATDHLDRTKTRPRRSWRKIVLLGSLSLLLLLVGGTFVWIKWVEHAAEKQLRAVIAELDQTDPGWRLEQIEDARKDIPDEENSALVVMQIVAKIPKPVPAITLRDQPKSWDMRLDESSPEEELEPDIYWELRNELKGIQPLLKQARGLANMKDGRFPITYSPDFIGTLLPYTQGTREVGYLLRKDLLVRAREHDIDGALESARAAIIAGRSIGDEPLLVSQLVRMACNNLAANNIERALAQGQASDQALDRLQRLLAEEEGTPFLLIGLRGERAGFDGLMSYLEDGKQILPGSVQPGVSPQRLLRGISGQGAGSNPLTDAWESVTAHTDARRSRPIILRMLTESIQVAQLPPEQRADRFKFLEQQVKSPDLPAFVRLLMPATYKIAESDLRTHATLRCAIVALAAERFRLANGRWPKDLAELVPAYLKQVPLDPYDGKPIRLRVVADGLLVYSIGPGRQYNISPMNRWTPKAGGLDVTFQLWNVDARRKPALNPDVGPPQPTEEDFQRMQIMDWQIAKDRQDPPPEEPKAQRPPP
jgi:hypothetical protein